MIKQQLTVVMLLGTFFSLTGNAADYVIDTKGSHASINFKIAHLGYSWLTGRFNEFEGKFSYDKENEAASTVEVTVNTASVDSNHAERDKHLRSEDFLNVSRYPQAHFVSTAYQPATDGTGVLKGRFTLNGVTLPVAFDVSKVGEGKDPWGGERVGFEGMLKISLKDYNINSNLGPASKELQLQLYIEGIKQ